VVATALQLFSRQHSIVILVQPIKHFGFAHPLLAAYDAVPVRVHLLEPFDHSLTVHLSSGDSFVSRNDTIVVPIEPIESLWLSPPFLSRNLAVTVGVEAPKRVPSLPSALT